MKQRIHIFDTIRGFTLLNMIAYHAIYNIVYIFNHPVNWYEGFWGDMWQSAICFTFILISGMCSHFSKHPFRRGLIIFGCGIGISLITYLVIPQELIVFGILSFMGLAMIITGLLRPLLKRIPSALGLILSLLIFYVTYHVPDGFISFGAHETLLPGFLCQNNYFMFLGFHTDSFSSSDYFPLIPWLFLYLAGFYLYKLGSKYNFGNSIKAFKIPFLSFVGKNTLPIYLLHQPVILGALYLIHAFFRAVI